MRRPRPPVRAGGLNDAIEAAARARHLVLLLDYDGTLVPFIVPPEAALPSAALRRLLRRLVARPATTAYIMSGRDRGFLEKSLGASGVGLVAEHGAWLRRPGQRRWRRALATFRQRHDWRRKALRLMRDFESRTPGARIERKSLSLAWHWRGVSPSIGVRSAEELALQLRAHLPATAGILIGDHVIEVRPHGVDKGAILSRLKADIPRDAVVVAIGDDVTDEDMFRGLGERAITIHVGTKPTVARFRLPDVAAVLDLLGSLQRTRRGRLGAAPGGA